MDDLTVHPDSAVPSAFDRGHLYSPTLGQTRYALNAGYAYDYRPGNDFEPMPDSPRGDGKAWAWWRTNVAKVPAADFLGLHAGDEVTLHCLHGHHDTATVIAAYRHGALVRFPLPVSHSNPDGTLTAEMYVHTRNNDGHWY
ncbi:MULTISPECIES: hypothetical protein [unclassified Streptomyces]|uniref:hypothetical protein n=1 Tax=unclassified Streptomyces TaxID=2593676 RepID=UPI00224EAFAA|nr:MULTISPECIES: hypothetical protein [unclassified Streptomyces]MCX4405928.1 hypothetical protein [Streptomyces sp. NBC_01764]MCX5189548.1 hypothetical protein [Streptomyces sp. NBC_00268]